jgi:phosphoribosylaminoimidazole-succinocarboxamide synthase
MEPNGEHKNPAIKKLIKSGKVKDIYDIGNGRILFEFSNRVSAFDVILPSEIPEKGEVLCRLAAFWFRTLGVPNHMLDMIPPNQMIVKKLEIVPIECVVRGYLYGSLYERVKAGETKLGDIGLTVNGLAAKLPEPLFDPTTKFEEKDRLVSKDEVIAKKWLTEEEFEWIKKKSIELYKEMSERVGEAGFILADIKFELGRDEKGEIILADSIGPDEFRLWSKDKYSLGREQYAFDKQVVRDWLTSIGFKENLDKARKLGSALPEPPQLPKDLIEETRRRYIYVFEKITGEKFR